MAKTSPVLIGILMILVLLVGLVAFGVPQKIIGGEEPGVITSCSSETTPNLTIRAYDNENPGTAIAEATNLYRLEGQKTWSTFTAGTGFAVQPLKTYEIVMGITTSDFTDNAYGQVFTYKVPCEETPEIEKAMYNDEIETSLTATFYNADGDASSETFTAGQTQDVSIKLQAGVDEVFGNPFYSGNPNVLCLDLNTTTWDQPEKVSVNGVNMPKVSTPQRHDAVAGKIAYCYELPLITEDLLEVVLKVNADDTTAPGVDDTAYIYAGNYYINGDTAEVGFGVENEEGTAVGTDASDSVTLDWTA